MKTILSELRTEMAEKLAENGFLTASAANQIASWDMFNQNSAALFFDADWMFGIKDGFDVVIGNPPYGAKLSEREKEVYRIIYPETQFKIDTYSLFILMAMSNSYKKGFCTYIIPNTLLDNYFEEQVRVKLLNSFRLHEINDLNDKVFDGAVVHAMIISYINDHTDAYDVKVNISPNLYGEHHLIPAGFFNLQDYHMISIRSYMMKDLMTKISLGSTPLNQILDIRQAIKSGNDKLYITDFKENDNCKPILRGKDIGRFSMINPNLYIKYGSHLACPRHSYIFEQPKILIREAGAKITATFDDENFYIMSSLYNAILIDNRFSLKYLLGILNSSLIQFLMNKLTFEKTSGAFTKAKIYHYYGLPIHKASNQEPLIRLVEKILKIKKTNPQSDTSEIENQIDLLVYKLYNLIYDEVLIVDPTTPITREEYEKTVQI